MSLPRDREIDATGSFGAPSRSSPFDPIRSPRWPRLPWDILLAVFLGGWLGGLARYAITSAWPTGTGRFPWATFSVNVLGAFVLALVVVVAADVVSSRYLRPLLGTGFCGAFTTFSSIVLSGDLLFAHHHPGTAVTYLAASIVAGLAGAASGLLLGRAVAANRRRGRESRGVA